MVAVLSVVISKTVPSLTSLGKSIILSSKGVYVSFLILLARVVRDRGVNENCLDFITLDVCLIGPLEAVLHVHVPAAIVELGVIFKGQASSILSPISKTISLKFLIGPST